MKHGNEPAFASATSTIDGHTFHQNGLTKHEYFAGLAMQGLLSAGIVSISQIPKQSIGIANALLLELSKERE